MVRGIGVEEQPSSFLRSLQDFCFDCAFHCEDVGVIHSNCRSRGRTIVVYLFGTIALVFGSLSPLALQLKSTTLDFDVYGLLAVISHEGVTGLAPTW